MKKYVSTILFTIIGFFFLCANRHPLHISSAELFLSEANNKWYIKKNVFTEDIELALSKINNESIKLDSKNDKNQTILENYINSKIKILKKNGKEINFNIQPYFYSPESVDIIIEFKYSRRFDIIDDFLFEIFSDHKNIYAIRKYADKGFSQHELTRLNSSIFTLF